MNFGMRHKRKQNKYEKKASRLELMFLYSVFLENKFFLYFFSLCLLFLFITILFFIFIFFAYF